MATKPDRQCSECGAPVPPRFTSFCCRQHWQDFHNRQKKRGDEVVPLMLAWRKARGSGPVAKAAFSAMIQLADKFIAEDRESNRPDMGNYVESRGWYGAPDKKTGDRSFHIQINVDRTKRRPRKAKESSDVEASEAA